ncbi:formate dehydrogenase alpha subunit [Enterobacter asburiae]|uniref:Formate dehydrogenase alpha subunit n=1 Tax=Enterobacter asburiae TaxID=61645 RepID=A0A376FJ71_ENTAS|nr:formate dehydrogenase alpha subunit [Enterobacter asburiae]
MREDYHFEDGLFSGYDAEKRKYDKTSWNYELDEKGFAKRDTTLQHPRCGVEPAERARFPLHAGGC